MGKPLRIKRHVGQKYVSVGSNSGSADRYTRNHLQVQAAQNPQPSNSGRFEWLSAPVVSVTISMVTELAGFKESFTYI